MVASNLHSNLSKSSSLELSLEGLHISSDADKLQLSADKLQVSDLEDKLQVSDLQEPTSFYDCSSSSEEEEEDTHEVQKSPFYVYWSREDVWSKGSESTPSHELEDANCGEGDSNSSGFSPVSPSSTSASNSVQWTKREKLLSEAWERKRELMLQEELLNLNEQAKPHLLGRSASYCGKPMTDTCGHLKQLQRSASGDCSKRNWGIWGTSTRSLTDHDFEELQGCIDLGFRFDSSSIPDLCNTLPALEVYCAFAHNFEESSSGTPPASLAAAESPAQSFTSSPTPSWSIGSPDDDPEEIKERLRHWAQAVACNARICY